MTSSPSITEEPVPWYRPVLKAVHSFEETFADPNYIILGSGMGLLVLALLVMICCCRCANQRRRKRHLEKRIEEEQNKEQTHDLIIKPNSSLYQRQSVKQNNIFRLDSHHGPDPQVMLDYTNEETLLKNGLIFEDILPAKPEADKNTTINETTINDTTVNESDAVDESSKNTSFNVHEPTPSTTESPRAKAASNSPQQFRLPPINMANSSFKYLAPSISPIVAKVNPVQVHVPTPPTSPMPADSPTISQASSTESLFDNIAKKKNSTPTTPKIPKPLVNGVAYSSLARKLFPLNTELLSFLAKEGLVQDWQIYTLNNRAIEAFLYKYVIFISDTDRQQLLTGIMLTRILIQIHARDAESSIEQARQRQTQISLNSLDTNMQQEAWAVSRTCPIGFGSYSPRRDILLDFEKTVPSIKHLLLAKGICGLTHLEQLFASPDKAEDLITHAEQLILSGDITVGGLDSLLRMMDGISQDATMHEFVKAQLNWDIEGGNAVEPRIVKRSIRTAVNVLKSNSVSKGLYQFHQSNTKTDLSIKRKFEVLAIGLNVRQY